MRKLILILTIIVGIKNSYSQSTLLWSEDFQTGLSNYFSDYPSIKTDNDTIKVIGRKNTTSGQRLLILNYNLSGDTLSTTTYGNDSVFNNTIIDYKFDTSNHIYILNKEQQGSYKSKIVLQKYSTNGNLIWVEQLQNFADTSYTPRSIGLINDTCVFITAYKEYDYPSTGDDVIFTTTLPYLYAYNSNGVTLWKREFDRDSEIEWFLYDIFIHNNTAFLFGKNNSSWNSLIKVDVYNTITINNNTGILNGINNVQLTPDSNLLITASANYRISKANLNGSVIWTQSYGTNLPSNVSGDEMRSTIQDLNGNIYITGRHYGLNYGTANYTGADILTLKYDNSGVLIWQNRYEYGIENGDAGEVILLKNGNVYVGGESQRLGTATDLDYIVIKIDSATGLTNGVYRYNGAVSGDDAVSSLFVFDNGNVALTGLSYSNSHYDWTTQLLSDVILSITSVESNTNIEIYPNPFSEDFEIKVSQQYDNIVLTIYDLLSRKQFIQSYGRVEKIKVSRNAMASGMYFYELKTNNKIIATGKIIAK